MRSRLGPLCRLPLASHDVRVSDAAAVEGIERPGD